MFEDQDELELLRKRYQDKFLAGQLQDSSNPYADLGLKLAAGGLDLLSRQSAASLDPVATLTGRNVASQPTTNAAAQVQQALAARDTAIRQKALDAGTGLAQIQKMIDEKNQKDYLAKRQPLELAKLQAEVESIKPDKELNRLYRQAQIDALKNRSVGSIGAGKTLPASQAESAGTAQAASQALDDITGIIEQNKDIIGPMGGRVSQLAALGQFGERGKQAANIKGAMDQRAQIIGKYLEGGKLTDQDIARYRQQLPQITDTPEVAQAKINSLRRLLANKQQAELSALQGAGYATGGIQRMAAPEFSNLRQSIAQKPKTVIQNGHTYILNEQTGEYE